MSKDGLHTESRRIPGSASFTVWIVNGVQSFRLDYRGTKKECDWLRDMLKKAGIPK
jgi:hypothetical protein